MRLRCHLDFFLYAEAKLPDYASCRLSLTPRLPNLSFTCFVQARNPSSILRNFVLKNMLEDIPIPLPEHLLAHMEATPQNPQYHREGSVLAHTRYVLQQYLAHEATFELSEDEKQILYWAAILHDVGKTVTTIWEQGRHRSPGHERAGIPFAQEILLARPEVSAHNRRRILDLVRWHGLPLRFGQSQQPIEVVKRLGTRTDLRLLGIFAFCDFMGRDCDDKPEVLAMIHQFKDVDAARAEFEMGRLSELEAAAAGWNMRHKNAVWNAYKIKDMRLLQKLMEAPLKSELETRGQRVTIVFGPPLSGKSTWLDRQYPDHFRVSLHEHALDNRLIGNEYLLARKLIEFKHLLQIYLNRHRHVILESRDLEESIRLRLADTIRTMMVELDYVVIESGLETLQIRNAGTETPMDEELLKKLYHSMDLIHPWEAHNIQYAIG
jgi:predicted kinase